MGSAVVVIGTEAKGHMLSFASGDRAKAMLGGMNSGVLCLAAQNLEIVRMVVSRVSVKMMNNLFRKERPTYLCLGHDSMLMLSQQFSICLPSPTSALLVTSLLGT